MTSRVGLFQLSLVEVTIATKTEPRCISQPRKLYATITEAKTQEALWTRQNLLAMRQTPTAMEVKDCVEEVLQRNYTHYALVMFSSLPKLPI